MIVVVFIIVALLLVMYAAICNAKMDIVKDEFSLSIYNNKLEYSNQWFDPLLSWTNKRNYDLWWKEASRFLPKVVFKLVVKLKAPKVWDPLSDFWHWNKSKMIVSLCGAGVSLFIAGSFLGSALGVIVASAVGLYLGEGIIWNEVFDYWYDKKLRRK